MSRALNLIIGVVFAASLAACSSSAKKSTPASAPVAAAATKSTPAAAKKSATTSKAAPATAANSAVATTEGSTVTCTSGKVQREITVAAKDGGCAVNYTKDGSTNEIATGAAGSSKCKDTQEKVKANLEKAGYTCK